jgi:hypothetical protein
MSLWHRKGGVACDKCSASRFIIHLECSIKPASHGHMPRDQKFVMQWAENRHWCKQCFSKSSRHYSWINFLFYTKIQRFHQLVTPLHTTISNAVELIIFYKAQLSASLDFLIEYSICVLQIVFSEMAQKSLNFGQFVWDFSEFPKNFKVEVRSCWTT